MNTFQLSSDEMIIKLLITDVQNYIQILTSDVNMTFTF